MINLHFHHVDPKTKSFVVSMAVGKALDTYRQEVKKCVLVCANCHGEIEAGLIDSPPAGATFADGFGRSVPEVAALGEDHRDAG